MAKSVAKCCSQYFPLDVPDLSLPLCKVLMCTPPASAVIVVCADSRLDLRKEVKTESVSKRGASFVIHAFGFHRRRRRR